MSFFNSNAAAASPATGHDETNGAAPPTTSFSSSHAHLTALEQKTTSLLQNLNATRQPQEAVVHFFELLSEQGAAAGATGTDGNGTEGEQAMRQKVKEILGSFTKLSQAAATVPTVVAGAGAPPQVSLPTFSYNAFGRNAKGEWRIPSISPADVHYFIRHVLTRKEKAVLLEEYNALVQQQPLPTEAAEEWEEEEEEPYVPPAPAALPPTATRPPLPSLDDAEDDPVSFCAYARQRQEDAGLPATAAPTAASTTGASSTVAKAVHHASFVLEPIEEEEEDEESAQVPWASGVQASVPAVEVSSIEDHSAASSRSGGGGRAKDPLGDADEDTFSRFTRRAMEEAPRIGKPAPVQHSEGEAPTASSTTISPPPAAPRPAKVVAQKPTIVPAPAAAPKPPNKTSAAVPFSPAFTFDQFLYHRVEARLAVNRACAALLPGCVHHSVRQVARAAWPALVDLQLYLREATELLDSLSLIRHEAIAAVVSDPGQYLRTPRYRLRCVGCNREFGLSLPQKTCGRCGDWYCAKCLVASGVGPAVHCGDRDVSLGWEPLCQRCCDVCTVAEADVVRQRQQLLARRRGGVLGSVWRGIRGDGGDSNTNGEPLPLDMMSVKNGMFLQGQLADGLAPFYVYSAEDKTMPTSERFAYLMSRSQHAVSRMRASMASRPGVQSASSE